MYRCSVSQWNLGKKGGGGEMLDNESVSVCGSFSLSGAFYTLKKCNPSIQIEYIEYLSNISLADGFIAMCFPVLLWVLSTDFSSIIKSFV